MATGQRRIFAANSSEGESFVAGDFSVHPEEGDFSLHRGVPSWISRRIHRRMDELKLFRSTGSDRDGRGAEKDICGEITQNRAVACGDLHLLSSFAEIRLSPGIHSLLPCGILCLAALVLLRSIPLLQNVSEASLKKISEAVQPVQFGPGESIVKLNCEGAGLYIIWKGEAKVISPPNGYPFGHRESFLRRGDYFGLATTGLLKEKYKADVVAINEVFCLVLAHEYAGLLSSTSIWDSGSMQGPSKIERVLQLETVEGDTFRTYVPVPHHSVSGNTYGGQFVSQALLAATKSVDPALLVHSLHCYFIRTGDDYVPIVYEVERTRDSQSFATRHVKAVQKGKVAFVLYASFKREEEGFEHSEPMPSVPRPEEVDALEQRYEGFLTDPRVPLATKKKYAGLKLPLLPIELRYINPKDKFQPEKLEPRQQIWMRARAKLSEDQSFHRCVGAYATDLCLLETCTRPHPETEGVPMQLLSLDHTIWFHRSFKTDEWLLYVCESPVATDGRGLVFGRIYTQDGKLVMSVAQEGIARIVVEKVAKVSKL